MFTQSFHKDFAIYDNRLKGKPIVFFHGLGASAGYGEFLTHAYPNNRILLIDLPAHGASQSPETDIYKIALELPGLFKACNIEKPVICGHSLGGQIALLFDIAHPHLTDSLILVSPAGLEDFNAFQKQAILSSLQFGNYMSQMFVPKINSNIKIAEGLFPTGQVISAYVRSMMERPVKDMLNRISCPATVIFGENDMLIPNRLFNMDSAIGFAHKVLDTYPNFKVSPIPNCGHWPMVENPKELLKILVGNVRV